MKRTGFSLIELLVAMAVFGILASFAVPSYQSYMNKSRRSDALATLTGLQLTMEKFRGNCAQFPTTLGAADDCATGVIKFPASSNEGHYTISVVAASSSGNSYKIQAAPTGVQTGDTKCGTLSITVNNANPKGLKEPANCW